MKEESRAYIRYLKETDSGANIICMDYYDLEFDNLKEYRALHTYMKVFGSLILPIGFWADKFKFIFMKVLKKNVY